MSRGFTLIELSVSVGIVALLISGTVVLSSIAADTSRISETSTKLTVMKRAILGDARIVTKEARTDFGYVGDVGSLPVQLQDLWIKPAGIPVYTYSTTSKTGAGWAGPYLQVGALEFANDLARDAWGNSINYSTQAGTSATTGQQYVAKLSSNGSDGIAGNSDDIVTEIYATEMYSTVTSYVRDASGNALSGVSVRANYPQNGILVTNVQATTDANGAFTFTNMPVGNRSVTFIPLLAYNDGSAVTTGGAGNNLQFQMLSFTCGSVTQLQATYDASAVSGTGSAYYTQLKIAGSTAYNNNNPRAASGQTLTFGAIDVSANGCSGGSTGTTITYPIRVQSAFTQPPDLSLTGTAASATAIQVQMNGFSDSISGGSNVDMTGVSMTISFTFQGGSALGGGTGTFTLIHQ